MCKKNLQNKHISPRRRLWLVVSSFCTALALQANNAWALDFEQSYLAASVNNASLKAARAAAAANREKLPQARAQLLPSISINVNRNHNDLTTRTQSYGQPVSLSNDYYSSSKVLSIRQALYRPQQFAALEQAKALLEDAEATLEFNERDLIAKIGETYFDALLAHDQVQLIAAQKKSFAAQLDSAVKSFQAGSGTRTDIDEAQARVDMTTAQELEVKQNQDLAYRRLQSLVGEPIVELATLDSEKFQAHSPRPANIEDWITLAEANNSELNILRAQTEAARLEVEKAQAGHKPTLDLVAQWSKTDSDSVTSINTRYDQKAVGIQFSMPIYGGGFTSSTIRQALAAHMQAQERLEAARLDLSLRVHEQFHKMHEGVLKISALQQAVNSAEQALRSNQKSFEAGSRTTLDVLNAEERRTQALRDLAQGRYLFIMARLQLQILAGNDKLATVQQANSALTKN